MIPADQDLLNAHAAGDTVRLCVLYHQAALASDDIDAACFYATHAYVFALECDHPSRSKIHAFLVKHGREE
jgi:hypothetical protein